MTDLNTLSLRQLQTESARALATIDATNNNIHVFNKQAHHNSQTWYKAVISYYIGIHGGLPSKTGPGITVKLIME